ncbi:MAG: hypothetical protein IJB57_09530 [Clostridia bacterium]|nr:hypothetical protein [Clostridia bacterium]
MNISNNNDVYNTYNLTVVGSCEAEKTAAFVKYFKDEIYSSFKDYTDFYNLDSLAGCEADPQKLNKTSKMVFRNSNEFYKTFLGFSSDKSIDERYKILFRTPSSFDLQYFLTPIPPYTNELLTRIMQEKLGTTNLYDEPFRHDISVNFAAWPDSKIYVEIKCSVSPNFDLPFDVLCRFGDIIEKADSLFSDEFCSAYVSYAPEHMSVTHTAICFRYDRQNVSEYILGGEWFVYMGKQIKDKLDPERIKAISKYASVTEYENGISYKADCDIADFDKYRSYYHCLLNDLLIPAYGEISWEQLTKGSAQYALCPSKVYVFNNNMIEKFGPDIVLAHNCSIEDVCRYDVKTEKDLIFSLDTSEE